ncbi:class F sortase [Acrocarpospora phusangensis]|uniref:class F sortase n=1 Tax=Acrocarpospora phusangensis TaxID=1070424 RepID=UPI001EF344B4|nr:class F sortase [Acrocarpospora phusangensis]
MITGFVLVAIAKPQTEPAAAPARSSAVPERIDIPALELKAPLMELGLTGSGEVELPPYEKPKVAGWYKGSAVPGDGGASVIIGHVDTKTAPAVFYRLKELRKGADVKVLRSDGKTISYTVDSVQQVAKERFPASSVYTGEGLRLVTCGGTFDWSEHEYEDNIIVYASRTDRT